MTELGPTDAKVPAIGSQVSIKCWRCFDTGSVLKERLVEGRTCLEASVCICARRKRYRALIARIPPNFGNPKLSRLRARPDLHTKQTKLIAFIKSHPDESFVFCGANGCGKSHFGWALYRNAVSQGRGVLASNVSDLLEQFRKRELGTGLEATSLELSYLRRSGSRWFLFLDEIEKARPSEFASEMLFKLLDTAKSFQHQLIVTSNMNINELRLHWGRKDQIWGESIVARLEHCHLVEMF